MFLRKFTEVTKQLVVDHVNSDRLNVDFGRRGTRVNVQIPLDELSTPELVEVLDILDILDILDVFDLDLDLAVQPCRTQVSRG